MIVRYLPRARRRLTWVDSWWRQNRPSSPNLFDDEVVETVGRLKDAPLLVGSVFQVADDRKIRRVLLPKTQQFLYYTVEPGGGLVTVITVWGAARGRGPRL